MKKLLILNLIVSALFLISCGSDDDGMSDVDNQAPSAPQNLTATNITENAANVSWEAANDNVGVTGYKLYIDGTNVQTITNGTQANITGLQATNSYYINVSAVDAEGNESEQSSTLELLTIETPLVFEENLSDMGIYTGDLVNLTPAENVHLYELNSQLFTDYAYKQRLIRFPNGQAMQYNGTSNLPDFPDNTLISKTFYYYEDEGNTSSNKIIIETRVLIKTEGTWKLGNYKWNSDYSEATYTENSSQISVSYTTSEGNTRDINYQIPGNDDCVTCHHIYEDKVPIGPKLRNMNYNPQNGVVNMNQIEYFIQEGLLEGLSDVSDITLLPNWEDEANFDIFERGRAYIDINCAHCHLPGGYVPTGFLLDFRLETDFETTGIYSHRGQIEDRIQSLVPTYMMPQIGRTLVHDEGVAMLLEYLEAIED